MSAPDPGWNDPPTVSYSGSSIGPKRTLLNKRVSFPVSQNGFSPNGSGITPNSFYNINSPVFFPSVSPISQVNEITYTKNDFHSVQDSSHIYATDKSDEEMLRYILSVFNEIISKIPPNSEFIAQKKIEDIKSRLKIFETMWMGNLSLIVKQKMTKLAEELTAKRYSEAHALHCNLIVDHVSEVSQWMVAVKHIVLISSSLNEPTM